MIRGPESVLRVLDDLVVRVEADCRSLALAAEELRAWIAQKSEARRE